MDEQKRCPVCGTEIPADADTCPECGMDDLNRIFLDKESYERWVETKLKPYASRYNKTVVAVAAGGSQEDVFPLKYDPYSRVRPVIAAGGCSYILDTVLGTAAGVKEDGTVVAVGSNDYGQRNVSAWHDIVAIAAGDTHTVGLKKDGTVIAVGSNDHGECDVSDWRDIVAIAAGGTHTVGLKKDGTVVDTVVDTIKNQSLWQVLWTMYCYRRVSDWRDIVAIAAGDTHTVGLKKDGTVVAVGSSNFHGECNVSDWHDIVAIAAGECHTVGLKKDGRVVAVGDSIDNVSDWRDIAAIAAGFHHTVGLKKDGTVIAAGKISEKKSSDSVYKSIYSAYKDVYSPWNACNKYDLRDIVAIAAGGNRTVGLKKDGTVIAVGRYKSKGLTELLLPPTGQLLWKLF